MSHYEFEIKLTACEQCKERHICLYIAEHSGNLIPLCPMCLVKEVQNL